MRNYPKFYITKKGERAARSGHPWVYGEEVTRVDGGYANGDLVDVVTEKGKYLGTGFVNDNSKIRVRILSTNANDKFDETFWERRLQYALDYRKTVMPGDDFKCCRLIFGEADQFPGWTVDRYNDLLVIQTLSLGIEQRKHILIPLLVKLLRKDGETITGVYERNDVKIRLLEGGEIHALRLGLAVELGEQIQSEHARAGHEDGAVGSLAQAAAKACQSQARRVRIFVRHIEARFLAPVGRGAHGRPPSRP